MIGKPGISGWSFPDSPLCTTFSLALHLFKDSGLAYVLAVVSSAAVSTGCAEIFEILLSILLDIYPEEDLLDDVVVLFLIF